MNCQRGTPGQPPIDFGIALHIGSVLYGNMGTQKRLDFTATRPAVGLVSRCVALTRALGTLLVAVEDFHILCPDDAQPLGVHTIRGFENGIDLFTYPL